MDNKFLSLFASEQGIKIFDSASSVINSNHMNGMLEGGVLVGLSGGADSVMLLLFLLEYRRRGKIFPIVAVHINHSIRGDAADSDEEFSRRLCEELGVEFISRKVDVPAMAKAFGLGIEECARNVRYSEFSAIISGRSDIASVAVAHNADDNLETVILNMLRGSGLRGVSGIPPVRDNICRPLLGVNKSDIINALVTSKILFVTDETNNETEYRRNYIRHKVVPALNEICDDPCAMVSRLSANLRCDDEYISRAADNIIGDERFVAVDKMRGLHRAVASRVIIKLAKNNNAEMTKNAVDALLELIIGDNFSWSLPGGCTFVCEGGICTVCHSDEMSAYSYHFKLDEGKNNLTGFDSDFYLSSKKIEKSCLNVYKISIQADISSAIIVGDLFLRQRCDGDVIYYGGITRKVKKLFSDLKVPKSLRESIPMLCDDKGVVWIPGLGVRDDKNSTGEARYACLAIGKGDMLSDIRMRSASEFKKNKA